jgi:hypothetical protein
VAAAADPLSYPASLNSTPELGDYLQFVECPVPDGSEAVRAYSGFIRPFSDDSTARRVFRAIEGGRALDVCGGRLDADLDLPSHPLEEFLVDMAVPFSVLALEFSDARRPRAYLLDPPMIPRLSACEHLRPDKSIVVNGVNIPALCVYSGNLLKFANDRNPVEQLLDQTATYLAKYLIWLRSRKLYRRTTSGTTLVRDRRPNEPVTTVEISRSLDYFWRGYWPGPSAPSGTVGHLNTISPNDECWCWSGKAYGDCCRPRELSYLSEWERARFVRKLMASVWSHLGSHKTASD